MLVVRYFTVFRILVFCSYFFCILCFCTACCIWCIVIKLFCTVFLHICMSMYLCIWYLVFLCWHFVFLYSFMFHLAYVHVPGMSALWSCCPGFVEMGAVCCEGWIANFLKTRSRLLHACRSHRLGCLLLTS